MNHHHTILASVSYYEMSQKVKNGKNDSCNVIILTLSAERKRMVSQSFEQKLTFNIQQ